MSTRDGESNIMPTAPSYIANFDSSAGMLRALGRFLKGKDFPRLGPVAPKVMEPIVQAVNRLPQSLREEVYIWSGWWEAARQSKLKSVSGERIAQWMVSEYPQRPYQAICVGSSNGAMIHLCAALGIPWLPQTVLIPVRRHGIHPDQPKDDLQWGKEPGQQLLEANPEFQLHHMNDANQDRLMIQHMAYFRVKWLRLAKAFREFIIDHLAPGGTIFISECNLSWATQKIGERHYFQHGALGGATMDEYHQGSSRVEEYLARYGSDRRRWDSPPTDCLSPEAEWGFEEALRRDLLQLACERGYQVRRVSYEQPEDLSPLVADLYRWWYRQRGMIANRLLVESFVVMEPYWTLRTGSVPFWMVFNKQPSRDCLGAYLDRVSPFDEVYMMLFSHGVDSVGLCPIERWREILQRARKHGGFIGVDEREYPRDFGVFARYHKEIKKQIPARYPLPGPLVLDQFDEFLATAGDRYSVQWTTGESPPAERSPAAGR